MTDDAGGRERDGAAMERGDGAGGGTADDVFFSSRRRLTRPVSPLLLNRPADLTELTPVQSRDVVEVVIWRESSVSGGSGAVQMFLRWQQRKQIGRAVQQECRDRSRMPSSA